MQVPGFLAYRFSHLRDKAITSCSHLFQSRGCAAHRCGALALSLANAAAGTCFCCTGFAGEQFTSSIFSKRYSSVHKRAISGRLYFRSFNTSSCGCHCSHICRNTWIVCVPVPRHAPPEFLRIVWKRERAPEPISSMIILVIYESTEHPDFLVACLQNRLMEKCPYIRDRIVRQKGRMNI